MDKKNKYPKSRLGWLWENMEGRHALFITALLGTALYNVLQLVVPHFSRQLINLFSEAQKTGQPLSDKEYGGVLTELVILGSVFVSIYRFGWKGLDDPEFKK